MARLKASARALFLDRDGVINEERSYVSRVEDFVFIEGTFESCRVAQQFGYHIVIITNQAGIGRGLYTESDYRTLTAWMLRQFAAEGIAVRGTYYCPYHPTAGVGRYRRDAPCRKPSPGMILQATADFDLDLTRSVLVGDKESDIEAGIRAGVATTVRVRSGYTEGVRRTRANVVLDSIADLGDWLQARECGLG